MADDDTPVVISSHLRPEEAGMLRGLLESAGIFAVVRDDVLSGVNPFLQPAIGGVKLAVRASDAERAQEIVKSAGAFPGPASDEPVEIPEEEWSRRAVPESIGGAESSARSAVTWPWWVVLAALVALAAWLRS